MKVAVTVPSVGILSIIFCCMFHQFAYAPLPPSIPRREDLVFYLPLNADDGLKDVAQNISPSVVDPSSTLRTSSNGPFGLKSTSYGVSDYANTSIAQYDHVPKMAEAFTGGEWTVAFFYKGNDTNKAIAIAEFRQSDIEVLSFYHFSTSVGMSSTYEHDDLSRGVISVLSALKPGIWAFAAITVSTTTRQVNAYSALGDFIGYNVLTANQTLYAGPNVILGRARYGRNEIGMDANLDEAVACLSVHSVVLSPAEIRTLYAACKLATKQQPVVPDVTPFIKQQYWPRAKYLTLYLPFNSNTSINDISDYRTLPWVVSHPLIEQVPIELIDVPSTPNTFCTVTSMTNGIADYYVPQITAASEGGSSVGDGGQDFTLAFQYYFEGSEWTGAILTTFSVDMQNYVVLTRGPNEAANFIVTYKDANHANSKFLFPSNRLINGTWNFVAMTYSNDTDELRIFGANGSAIAEPVVLSQKLLLGENLALGRNVDFIGADANMVTGDGVACLSIHSGVILSPEEIAQLAKSCVFQTGFKQFCNWAPSQRNNPKIPAVNSRQLVGCSNGQWCAKSLSFGVDAEYSWGCIEGLPADFPCNGTYDVFNAEGGYKRTCTCCDNYCNNEAMDDDCLPLPPTTIVSTTEMTTKDPNHASSSLHLRSITNYFASVFLSTLAIASLTT